MEGIEGIVVGIVGNGVAGSGGRVTLGAAGMEGNVGIFGKGIWVLGIKGVVGNVGLGKVGKEGSGDIVGLRVGREGIVGSTNAGGGAAISKRCRAARLISMLDKDKTATTTDSRKQCLKAAIASCLICKELVLFVLNGRVTFLIGFYWE
ncbi:unnamed protein product [Prunus armeniaca]|uniref:Uncharacterized protein n=1 Tax=Prunus armeniaca TaxID=36596 RepID=A0A6J5V4C9_PRUAR|nr:unnamed protein product [Prunus armeniaca]